MLSVCIRLCQGRVWEAVGVVAVAAPTLAVASEPEPRTVQGKRVVRLRAFAC